MAQSVRVTLADPVMFLGAFQRATAITQPPLLLGEWRSDNPAVVSIDEKAGITATSLGEATISHRVGDRVGTSVVRVVPDYRGRWSGRYSVTSCRASGWFSDTGYCAGVMPVGFDGTVGTVFEQRGARVTGRLTSDALDESDLQAAELLADGSLLFSARIADGLATVRWQLPLMGSAAGALAQSGTAIYTRTEEGRSGEARLTVSVSGLRKQ